MSDHHALRRSSLAAQSPHELAKTLAAAAAVRPLRRTALHMFGPLYIVQRLRARHGFCISLMLLGRWSVYGRLFILKKRGASLPMFLPQLHPEAACSHHSPTTCRKISLLMQGVGGGP